MLANQTIENLRELRLIAMADAYAHQCQDPTMNSLSFDERFGLLIDYERTARQNRQLTRLLREAHLKIHAAPEEIDYSVARGLDASIIRQLTTGRWIGAHQNLIVSGPTGVGKTFLICALATAACRQGFHVRYHRLSHLIQEIAIAKADGTYPRLRRQLGKADVLILDDWGLAPMNGAEGRELLDILDDRTSTQSTCVASQLPIESWYGTFADPTVADAVLDRLVHSAHKIILRGESMRKLKNTLQKDEKIGK